MSGFSPTWLALREPADHRSRSQSIANTLQTRFLQRETINVIDLGCGTGSNLRATAPLLPHVQHWTLVDYDPALLAAAKEALIAWADTHAQTPDGLNLQKGPRTLTIKFHQADLMTALEAALDVPPKADLITASALFDLASPAFIQKFAAAVAERRAVFYTVLTYNGIQRWTPRTPLDQSMSGAFSRHQMTDKGFGPSCGPTAPVELAEQFQTYGYTVEEGDSPWRLGPADAALITELATGFASAVRETKSIPGAEIDAWLKRPHTGAEVGHTDTLAIPGPRPSTRDDD
ncbi:MAG: class I SAM-dependent methyltransferase [Hyphomicrobiaceae bacterium]